MAHAAEIDAMRRALALAGRGDAAGPNPRVGAVVLSPDGDVVAEGWHHRTGMPHAEVEALAALPAGAARGATVVVTLEPCNHRGRTGPCSVALADAGVARVVYAVADPSAVAGGGGAHLLAAGVDVESGVLADEVAAFLGDWLAAARRGRPHVTLKWASSLDGRIAAEDGSSRWITGTAARQRVHEQRAASDAVLVGTGTVLADDPSLTARGDAGELMDAQPVPVVVGLRPVPDDAALWRHPRTPVLLATHDVGAALDDLTARGVRSVLVEAGPTLASALLAAGVVDEVTVYLAPVVLGGPRTATGDVGVGSIGEGIRFATRSVERIGADVLVTAVPLARRDARETAAAVAVSDTRERTPTRTQLQTQTQTQTQTQGQTGADADGSRAAEED